MALVITGASLLGETTADLYVDDDGLLVDDAPAGAETLDAAGLVALPGLVDLHTHLREPGREDAETILTGSQAAALGGYTAVLAMANTSPVTDTAEAALRVWELGREAGLVHVQPVGCGHPRPRRRGARRAGPDGAVARAGPRLLRRREVRPRRAGHASGAGVRQGLRRRRLPALPGPVAGRAECLLPRGRDLRAAGPARLARHRRGGHRRPRRDAGAAHRLARARRPRLHGRVGRDRPLGQGAGRKGTRRHRRGHPAPPPADDRPAHRLRPDLQGEPAAATRRGRPGPAGRTGRRHDRRRRHRPRPARAPRQGARVRRCGVRHGGTRDRAQRRTHRHGRLLLGRHRSRDVDQPGPHRRADRSGAGAGRGLAGPRRPHRSRRRGHRRPRRVGVARRATTRGTGGR